MKSQTLLLAILLTFVIPARAQKGAADSPSLKLGGYINWTAAYDSRQTVSLREGQFLLYPANKDADVYGNDANAKSNFNMLSVQSRINITALGVEILGAKAKGFAEAEFFGIADGTVNEFRLRHAFMELKWNNSSILVGQTWHPMFITESFPQVISFNTGAPFQPFSRNPQIRFTQSLGNVNLIAVLYTQRDFTSNGPSGYSSCYLRNSALPAAHFQIQVNNSPVLFGAGIDYKALTPKLKTDKNLQTDETIQSLAGVAYFKYSNQPFGFAAEAIYGQNMADLLMLGGYAVSKIDTATSREIYTNIKSYSLWIDTWYGSDVQYGIFAGYAKNLGADETIIGKIYSRGDNIGEVLRVAPRVLFTFGKIKIGFELEYTQALYGKAGSVGKIDQGNKIGNTRLLLETFYNL